jgi:hypothetical protein
MKYKTDKPQTHHQRANRLVEVLGLKPPEAVLFRDCLVNEFIAVEKDARKGRPLR